MHQLLRTIQADMKPALGVTEPGAIAYAAARARAHAPGEIRRVAILADSGIYKNAFTCGIPGSVQTGAVYAAALGVTGGDPGLGLEVLDAVTDADRAEADRLVAAGKVTARLRNIASEIYLEATVETDAHTCTVCIAHTHLGVTKIELDGAVIFEQAVQAAASEEQPAEIHR